MNNTKDTIEDKINLSILSYIKENIDDHLLFYRKNFPIMFQNNIDEFFSYKTIQELKQFNQYIDYYIDRQNNVKCFFNFYIEQYQIQFLFFIPFESNERDPEEAIIDIFEQFLKDNYRNDLFHRYLKYLSLKIFQKQVKQFLNYQF
tara:strand:+ start:13986 stop:14423 length:438 start_codon:yes stop_codon:yes gene_type:complete